MTRICAGRDTSIRCNSAQCGRRRHLLAHSLFLLLFPPSPPSSCSLSQYGHLAPAFVRTMETLLQTRGTRARFSRTYSTLPCSSRPCLTLQRSELLSAPSTATSATFKTSTKNRATLLLQRKRNQTLIMEAPIPVQAGAVMASMCLFHVCLEEGQCRRRPLVCEKGVLGMRVGKGCDWQPLRGGTRGSCTREWRRGKFLRQVDTI